jgi:hypothetical protein
MKAFIALICSLALAFTADAQGESKSDQPAPRLPPASQAPQAESPVQPISVEPQESATPLPATITIVEAVSIPVQHGSVTLKRGTRLQLLSRDQKNVVIRYLDSDYEIPISWTDLK